MDKVVDSGSTDAGSIPARDANEMHSFRGVFFYCRIRGSAKVL